MGIIQLEISKLHFHPRNHEFFDDITGEKWDELLNSIKFRVENGKRGNIDPIIVTEDFTIVSGHQRVRAFKELGIPTIDGEIVHYNTEDEVLCDLIETNIRQRGNVGGSVQKIGKRIKELERIYGIKHGNNQTGGVVNLSSPQKTQEQLAKDLGISIKTLHRYKELADIIPEVSDLLDEDKITQTAALSIIKKLSEEEQIELISTLPSGQKFTQKQIEAKIKEFKDEKISQLEEENIKLRNQPRDSQVIEDLEQKLKETKEDNQRLSVKVMENAQFLDAAMKTTDYQLVSHCSEITLKILNFISEMSKYDYLSESFNNIPYATRREYERCIKAVEKWASNILSVIEQMEDIIDEEGEIL